MHSHLCCNPWPMPVRGFQGTLGKIGHVRFSIMIDLIITRQLKEG